MYSYVKDNEKGGRTARGIKKNVIKNNIRHEDYKNTLIYNEQMHHKMKTIRSQRHQLGSYEINKVSLSFFNPISPGRFNTFPTLGGQIPPPLRNFASLHPNQTKFGVLIVRHKKKIN